MAATVRTRMLCSEGKCPCAFYYPEGAPYLNMVAVALERWYPDPEVGKKQGKETKETEETQDEREIGLAEYWMRLVKLLPISIESARLTIQHLRQHHEENAIEYQPYQVRRSIVLALWNILEERGMLSEKETSAMVEKSLYALVVRIKHDKLVAADIQTTNRDEDDGLMDLHPHGICNERTCPCTFYYRNGTPYFDFVALALQRWFVQPNESKEKEKLTIFHAIHLPAIAIGEYWMRLVKFLPISIECGVLTVRHIRNAARIIPISARNIHRLVLVALWSVYRARSAEKKEPLDTMLEEQFARVGGIKHDELLELERSFANQCFPTKRFQLYFS